MENGFNTLSIGGAEVVVDDNVFSLIPDKICSVSKEGAICVVYDKNLKGIALSVCDVLRKLSRRIFLCELDKTKTQHETIPDFVRYIVAVGCGFAARKADAISKAQNVPWSLLFTAPTTDTILQGKSPKHVFIDKNMMINCPKRLLAAGFGVLFSRRITAFESEFESLVLAGDKPSKSFEIKGELDPVSLAVCLLEMSACKKKSTSAETVAQVLYSMKRANGEKPMLVGEYEFIAGSYLLKLYSLLLSSPAIDTALPPLRAEHFDRLAKIGCENLVKQPKSIDFFETNSYFRISYILSEYRTDLLDKLGAFDSKTAQRSWRRIYDDAGYFLKKSVAIREIQLAVTLAGSVNENLLGFAYAQGVLPCKST